MWPPGHLAAGYLVFAAVTRVRRPSRACGLALAFGTLFPDLLDKPSAWWLAVLPSRSLGHSLLVALVLLPAVAVLCRRLGRPGLAAPFALGHLSHLAADTLRPLALGRYADLGSLLWPLARRPTPALVGLGPYVRSMLLSPYTLGQVVLVGIALAVWWSANDSEPSDR